MGYDLLTPRAVEGMFYTEYDKDESFGNFTGIIGNFTSPTFSKSYPWIGANKKFSEVGGGSEYQGHNQAEIVVVSKHYDNVFDVYKFDMNIGNTAQLRGRLSSLVREAKYVASDLASQLLLAGETSVCYDGQYFFDTDHEFGESGTWSNIVTVDISTLPVLVHGASAAAPSPEEIQQSVIQCIQQLMSIPNDKGRQENSGATRFKVMLPISLWGVMFNSIVTPSSAGPTVQQSQNLGDYTIDYTVNFDLSSWTTDFVVARTDHFTTAFIGQEVQAPMMQYAQKPASTNGWHHIWDVDLVYGLQYGRPERIVKCKMV